MSSFPSTWDEAKKFTKQLGLGYEKICACPNDCILYWGDNVRMKKCNTCQTSSWKTTKIKEADTFNLVEHEGKPAKILRFFPLIPRLKRIFMSSKTAEDMIWHDKERENDGVLRHPADGLAWKKFDQRYPEFTSDPRSVRFGLAIDGFNPFRLMNSTYSKWPVVLIPYNLPPGFA